MGAGAAARLLEAGGGAGRASGEAHGAPLLLVAASGTLAREVEHVRGFTWRGGVWCPPSPPSTSLALCTLAPEEELRAMEESMQGGGVDRGGSFRDDCAGGKVGGGLWIRD